MSAKPTKRKSADFTIMEEVERRSLRKGSLSSMSLKRQETLTQIGWIPTLRGGDGDDSLEYEEVPRDLTIKSSNPRAGRKRRKLFQKETLTQMDFLSPGDTEREDPSSDDHEGHRLVPRPASFARKRPKMLKEEPLAREIQTRSVRRRAAQRASTSISEDNIPIESPTVYPVQRHGREQPQPPMPQPRTPQIRRIREVPSSQSPPDTPLSTHSRRSWGSPTRSPLQARSPNIRTAATPSSRRRLFPTKLEIADTMDSGEEDSQTPLAAVTAKEDYQIYMPAAPRSPSVPDLNALKSGGRSHSPVNFNDCASSAASRQVKSEILDSEDEGTDHSVDENDFAAGAETQAACEVIASSSPSQFKEKIQLMSVIAQTSSAAEQGEDQETEGMEDGEVPSPPRLAPETESQFENAWRSLSPPPPLSSFSSSPNHISPNDPSTPSPPSPFKHPQPPTQAAPIPPSQATTVDITQRTQPHLPLPLPTNLSSSTSKKTSRKLRSSSPSIPRPPPPHPLSSSPLCSRKMPYEEPWTGYGGGWDNRRLTDSQLLPDSLMNDTFAGPPGWDSQEIENDGMEYEDV